jgi:hypothetical protein
MNWRGKRNPTTFYMAAVKLTPAVAQTAECRVIRLCLEGVKTLPVLDYNFKKQLQEEDSSIFIVGHSRGNVALWSM